MTAEELRQDLFNKIRTQYFNCVQRESFEEAACYNHAALIVLGGSLIGDN
jgi:hypothetical protein